MLRRQALAVVMVLLLVGSSAGLAGAVSPDGSLASAFDATATTTDTVVVAVGDPGTDTGRAALLAANAIANTHDATVVQVPDHELPYSVVQTLSQRVKHDGLRHAIVVGVGANTTDAVATALTAVGADVGGDAVTLAIEDQITGDSARDLLYRATVQSWTSSDAVFLTTTTETDSQKVSLALANEIAGPVLAQSMGYSDLNATLDYLNTNIVYVTPGVSSSTRDALQDDGYTVTTAPGGVDLDQSVQQVATGYAPDTVEDVLVVSPGHVHIASQVGAGANATVLVTEGDALDATTRDQLGNLTAVDNVYVLGNDADVADAVFSNVSNTVRANASTDRIGRQHGDTELFLRTSLLVAGYEYSVLTSHVETTTENVTVDITNIGFSTVQTADNVSVTAAWDGDIERSSPDGELRNGQWIVTHDDAMDPGDSVTVSLQANRLENAGHPYLTYYVGESGALVGATGGLGFFHDTIQGFAEWLLTLVDPFLPVLNLDTTSPIVLGGVLLAAVIVALGVVYAFKRGVTGRRR